MSYKVRLDRGLSKRLGAAGLTRNESVRLLAWLSGDLPERADEHRHVRASDAIGCFAYYVNLEADDDRQIILCRFVVNDDRAAEGLLEVKNFTFERVPRTGGA